MALAPGEVRKDLSADSLFRVLRAHFGSLPDPRSAEVEIPLDDALTLISRIQRGYFRNCSPVLCSQTARYTGQVEQGKISPQQDNVIYNH